MFNNYKHLCPENAEKWQIYSEVVRRIYSEITGYKISDKGLKDSKKYEESMIKGVYQDPEYN